MLRQLQHQFNVAGGVDLSQVAAPGGLAHHRQRRLGIVQMQQQAGAIEQEEGIAVLRLQHSPQAPDAALALRFRQLPEAVDLFFFCGLL